MMSFFLGTGTHCRYTEDRKLKHFITLLGYPAVFLAVAVWMMHYEWKSNGIKIKIKIQIRCPYKHK